jgi:hypothetical protein
VYGVVWSSGLLMSTLWTQCPIGLRTTNTIEFYQWQFEFTVTRSWGQLSCH